MTPETAKARAEQVGCQKMVAVTFYEAFTAIESHKHENL
ncbi:hypothetical protein X474_12310 [Dethiosulfatarculus sandiegensis]|uniref:Uncharacterized protein n=1 Tax=Dethiosulfatarculus sandiegensis TaxID=1429043 RepID=A0A0D2GGA2_9BACT|nr:hypothetical protein X474_12310 [Dethiosulfatarculus sandiegensis]